MLTVKDFFHLSKEESDRNLINDLIYIVVVVLVVATLEPHFQGILSHSVKEIAIHMKPCVYSPCRKLIYS